MSRPKNIQEWDALKTSLKIQAQNFLKDLKIYSSSCRKELEQITSTISFKDEAQKASDAKLAQLEQLLEKQRYRLDRAGESIKARDETIESQQAQISKLQVRNTDLVSMLGSSGDNRKSWFRKSSSAEESAEKVQKLTIELGEMHTLLSNKERKIQDLRDKPCHNCELRHKEIAELEARLATSERLRNWEPSFQGPRRMSEHSIKDRQNKSQQSVLDAHRNMVELQIIRCRTALDQNQNKEALDTAEEAIANCKHQILKDDKILLGRCHFWAGVSHLRSGKREYARLEIVKARQLGCGSSRDESQEGVWMTEWLKYFKGTSKTGR